MLAKIQREDRAMTTMMHWSPFTSKFHLHHHHLEDLFPRFVADAADEAAPPAASWLPAAEGRLEDGTYIIQFALPGVDPKAVEVSVMDNFLTVKGGQGLLCPRGHVRGVPAERDPPRGGRPRPGGGHVRERHARGESPRAASRGAEDDRSQGRLIEGVGACRDRPARAPV